VALDRPLVITAGEPAGIGPELCNALVGTRWQDRVEIIGDRRFLDDRLDVNEIRFPVGVAPGRPAPENANALLEGLRVAADGCLSGRYAAMVTAPVAKRVIADSGVRFSGHTEFLAERLGVALPVMMLVAGDLRVALATTHLPLRDVADALDMQRITDVVEILHADLRNRFGIEEPEIVVCGLNPHAGEGGHLGREEDEFITPALDRLRSMGRHVRGPLPADTAFTPAAGRKDAVLAMYHDQGLPVLKYAGFGHAVNVTLGLPIIRTSVDHGTAFDIAGTGKADAGSLIAALELAATMAEHV
jgi:4-hydroxythreonine-4-phosphate dehydrogenase